MSETLEKSVAPISDEETLDRVIDTLTAVALMDAPDYVVVALSRWCAELHHKLEDDLP